MTKTFWQTGIFPGHALFSVGRYSDCQVEELKKLEASEMYPRRLNAKEENFQGETTNSKNSLWNLSGESHGDGDLKNQKLGKTSGLFKDTSLIVIMLNREFNLRAERRIIPFHKNYNIERNSSEKKYTMREEDWKKPKQLR